MPLHHDQGAYPMPKKICRKYSPTVTFKDGSVTDASAVTVLVITTDIAKALPVIDPQVIPMVQISALRVPLTI